jgi:MoxR-like ATPase
VTTTADARDLQLLDRLKQAHREIADEIGQRIIGQHEIVDNLVAAILAGGHVLLIGVPGLAKTLLIQTIAETLDLHFSRVQFTPDLMPSDITGTELLEEDHGTGKRSFKFAKGPVFGNVVLADEINRAPPKTQAALLQAMQEHTVTVAGSTYPLPDPFFVLATQNPIELEGTYPLPEAQLDRFLFNTVLGYLDATEELKVIGLTTTTDIASASTVTNAEEILACQQLVRMVPVAESVASYAIHLVRCTRPTDSERPEFIHKYVNYGASVRAAQFLVLAAKARALMNRRYHVTYEDIRALAVPVLRHRVLLNFQAESDRLNTDAILTRLLEERPAPRQ